MPLLIHAVGRPELPPFRMPDRFRHEITFFMTPGGDHGVPKLSSGEYWIRRCDAQTCFDDGEVRIVSPLDSDSQAELELTEEQEAWLEWMLQHGVEHVRVESVD
ncbi:MAG: hypothetical protein ACKV0T_29230 [Planctomycetales bacterium]